MARRASLGAEWIPFDRGFFIALYVWAPLSSAYTLRREGFREGVGVLYTATRSSPGRSELTGFQAVLNGNIERAVL